MNHLNSLVLEGNITGEVIFSRVNGVARADYVLASSRYYKDGKNKTKCEVSNIKVRSAGIVADKYASRFAEGRALRIVGRLCNESDGGVFVLTEHVEFRPSYVYEVSMSKGIPFEQVEKEFLQNGYSKEDADNFWNSKWSDVQEGFIPEILRQEA